MADTGPNVSVDVAGLANAGRLLTQTGADLSQRVGPTVERIRALSHGMVAGTDKTGRRFHQDDEGNPGYNTVSDKALEAVLAIPAAYTAHGEVALEAARLYGEIDDATAQSTSSYIGIWGAGPEETKD